MNNLKILAAAMLIGCAFATSASATNGRDAIATCSSNPNCTSTPGRGGSVTISIDNGKQIIWCPNSGTEGECAVVRERPQSSNIAGHVAGHGVKAVH